MAKDKATDDKRMKSQKTTQPITKYQIKETNENLFFKKNLLNGNRQRMKINYE